MKKISNLQFFITVISFILGSAILFPLGIKAKQDAYLVILCGMIMGILLCLVYIKINSITPNQTFIQIVQKVFGRYLGWILGLFYSTFFIYITVRNIRDLAEQITQFVLPNSNMIIIITLIAILAIYATYQGLYPIIRVAVIIFPYTFLILIIINTYLLYFSGNFNNLLPILSKGFKPIWKEIYPGIIAFPFAELSIFMMIIPEINDNLTNIKKSFITATICASLILTINTLMMITVLGAELAGDTTFPLIKSGQLVRGELANFDFFISLATMLILITKISILMYGGVKSFSQLFKISYKQVAILLPLIAIYLAMIVAKGYPQHLELGLGPSFILNIIIGVYLPSATLIFHYLKKFLKNRMG